MILFALRDYKTNLHPGFPGYQSIDNLAFDEAKRAGVPTREYIVPDLPKARQGEVRKLVPSWYYALSYTFGAFQPATEDLTRYILASEKNAQVIATLWNAQETDHQAKLALLKYWREEILGLKEDE